jgi:hypothetical protein
MLISCVCASVKSTHVTSIPANALSTPSCAESVLPTDYKSLPAGHPVLTGSMGHISLFTATACGWAKPGFQ